MKYPQVVSMPSAVSDWLEEQLEARGIDSEVYARYIISLLHTHTLDFIFPEDDFSFSGLKQNNGGRSAVLSKRIRRAESNWWRHADPEQIKRSAAVECLMSAADQSCEIESLVDELCEKLKQTNSSPTTESDATIASNKEKHSKFSSEDLAEKYYAAFPPLTNDSCFSNINLVAGKWPATLGQSKVDLSKWTSSPKKSRRRNRKSMEGGSRQQQNSRFFGHKRSHCGRNVNREMNDNFLNWNKLCGGNQDRDQCLETNDNYLADDPDMYAIEETEPRACRMNTWLQNVDSLNSKYIPLYPTAIWSSDNDFKNDCWSMESAVREEYQRNVNYEEEEEEECAIKEEYDREHLQNYSDRTMMSPEQLENNVIDFGLVRDDLEEELTGRGRDKLPTLHDLSKLFDDKTASLMMVNHSMDNSAFCEYEKPSVTVPLVKPSSFKNAKCIERDKAPAEMYFEPIKSPPKCKDEKQFQDGATFKIDSSIDRVQFQRTKTGTLLLESELGDAKKYFEYRWRPPTDEPSFNFSHSANSNKFNIKYWVSPNDKSCQTTDKLDDEIYETLQTHNNNNNSKNGNNNNTNKTVWSLEAPKSSDVFCKHCNVKHPWNGDWHEPHLKEIWAGSGGVASGSCPWTSKPATPLEETRAKLREESKEEAEQLLSDLSSLQLNFEDDEDDDGPIEKKRRHTSDVWSFAERLDCLINLAALPARRSVTL